MYMSYLKPSPPFCYATVAQALAAAATIQPVINIANDCDFQLIEIRGIIHKAAAFSGTVLLQLRQTGGDVFSNVAIDMLEFSTTILATATPKSNGYPVRLPLPIIIPANTEVTVSMTNNNGEELTSIQLQLWGIKVPMKETKVD